MRCGDRSGGGGGGGGCGGGRPQQREQTRGSAVAGNGAEIPPASQKLVVGDVFGRGTSSNGKNDVSSSMVIAGQFRPEGCRSWSSVHRGGHGGLPASPFDKKVDAAERVSFKVDAAKRVSRVLLHRSFCRHIYGYRRSSKSDAAACSSVAEGGSKPAPVAPGSNGGRRDGKSQQGDSMMVIRGGPVSWLSFLLLLVTGGGIILYYHKEKKRHIEDFYYMMSTKSANGCLHTENNKCLATDSRQEIEIFAISWSVSEGWFDRPFIKQRSNNWYLMNPELEFVKFFGKNYDGDTPWPKASLKRSESTREAEITRSI